MCYHFMFLKPIDSHGSFSSLPCLYLILFAIALHCFKVLYSNLRFWQDSISWGLIFAILKEGIKFHNFSIFNFILFFKNSELFKFLENVEQQLALTLYSLSLQTLNG